MTDYTKHDDRQLIAACRDGTAGAWDALVARYERLVYTVPLRYGLTQAEADDVFQSVWLALLRHLPTLKQPDRVSAWLVTTARRESWDRRRGSEHERTYAVDPGDMPEDRWLEVAEPEEIVSRHERHRHVRVALQQLQERCRRLLHFLYNDPDEPSYADVAARLDIPVGSIGPTRARCLKKLRRLLEKEDL